MAISDLKRRSLHEARCILRGYADDQPEKTKRSEHGNVVNPSAIAERTNAPSLASVRVNIKPLKAYALKSLPPDSKLRAIILKEPDEMSGEAYVAKMGVWMMLLSVEVE